MAIVAFSSAVNLRRVENIKLKYWLSTDEGLSPKRMKLLTVFKELSTHLVGFFFLTLKILSWILVSPNSFSIF